MWLVWMLQPIEGTYKLQKSQAATLERIEALIKDLRYDAQQRAQ